ncbi:MAG: hypothetical protein M5U34_36200 [Chloroflexi bacterium]|nr:hypothetical protein [Chloroflexota bacterium]
MQVVGLGRVQGYTMSFFSPVHKLYIPGALVFAAVIIIFVAYLAEITSRFIGDAGQGMAGRTTAAGLAHAGMGIRLHMRHKNFGLLTLAQHHPLLAHDPLHRFQVNAARQPRLHRWWQSCLLPPQSLAGEGGGQETPGGGNGDGLRNGRYRGGGRLAGIERFDVGNQGAARSPGTSANNPPPPQ